MAYKHQRESVGDISIRMEVHMRLIMSIKRVGTLCKTHRKTKAMPCDSFGPLLIENSTKTRLLMIKQIQFVVFISFLSGCMQHTSELCN